MNIQIHIERLVLDGLPVTAAQALHVRAAVERELSQMLARNGLGLEVRSGGATPAVHGGTIQFSDQTRPANLGKQIAAAVYGSIGTPADGGGPENPGRDYQGRSR